MTEALLTKRSLGQVQAGQVIRFGAGLLAAEHQLTSVAAAKTLVLRLLLSFAFPLFVLSLPPLRSGLSRVAVGVLREKKGRHGNYSHRHKTQEKTQQTHERRSPSAGRPGNRCSSARRSSRPFSRCRGSPSCS